MNLSYDWDANFNRSHIYVIMSLVVLIISMNFVMYYDFGLVSLYWTIARIGAAVAL